MPLTPKTVLVTGTSRGIGLEFVKQFLNLPTPPEKLVAACRNPSTATELQKLAAGNATVKVIKLDVENDEDIDAAFKQTEAALGDRGLNLLISNAGFMDRSTEGSLKDITRANMQKHFSINATSPVMIVQKFLPLLVKAASQEKLQDLSASRAGVVMISGRLGSQGFIFKNGYGSWIPYKCSKTALNMATIMISRELKDSGILVTAIHPGWVRTDMGTEAAPTGKEESVADCLKVIGEAGLKTHGKLIDYQGQILDY
ncbi:C-signal-like [Physella acuta]|uniref:C-signal-like n=1 Tax=Physella acuta TaxID=109671 RepID=UPI0027DCFEFC|nr:C-signal-like [Physella acuta]XP_059146229.1 C-signal-like [Physella acuta]XP_059146230.1 C-signal-like [Physella acuta]